MLFLSTEDILDAVENTTLEPIKRFALEVELGVNNPLHTDKTWHEFYPPESIPRNELDALAERIASEGERIVEITNAPDSWLIRLLRFAYGPKQPALVFRVL